MNAKPLFSRFLGSDPRRLHVAAHSHHPWPDVTFAAQQRAWNDAAAHHDDKWSVILDQVVPEAQGHIARILGLADPRTIAFAPNTHEFLLRILSCLPAPTRILTTDSEFHSFTRQVRRLEEDGGVLVQRIAADPYASFDERFATAAAAGGHHLVFLSHVHFNSGYVTENLDAIVDAVADPGAFVVIDGYHGFMALPTDLSRVHARAFYVSGGYKYAMAGEGAAFLHCPPGYGPRPPNTGWYAGFGALTESLDDPGVPYATDGTRFIGATFDPSGLYRFNAVQRLLTAEGIGVSGIHAHVRALQARFLDRLGGLGVPGLNVDALLPPPGVSRGHFLTFGLPDAEGAYRRLAEARVVTDHRGDRLRLGFGLYHDETDLDALCDRLVSTLGAHEPARGS